MLEFYGIEYYWNCFSIGLDIEDGKVVLTAEVINPIPAEKSSIERDYIVRYVQGVGNNILKPLEYAKI